MNDEQLAEFMMLTLLECLGESRDKIKSDWDRMSAKEKKPFVDAAKKFREKVKEVENVKS